MMLRKKTFERARKELLKSYAEELRRCRCENKIRLKTIGAYPPHFDPDYIDKIELACTGTYPGLNTLVYIALACGKKISIRFEDLK